MISAESSKSRYYANIVCITAICLIILYDLYALYICKSSIWDIEVGDGAEEYRNYYFVNIEKSNITVDDVRYNELIKQGLNPENDKDSGVKLIIDNMHYKLPDKPNDDSGGNYDPCEIKTYTTGAAICDNEVYSFYFYALYKIRDVLTFCCINILAYTIIISLLIYDMKRIACFYKKLFIVFVWCLSIATVLFIYSILIKRFEGPKKGQIILTVFYGIYNLLVLILLFRKVCLKNNYISLSYISRLKFIVICIFVIVFSFVVFTAGYYLIKTQDREGIAYLFIYLLLFCISVILLTISNFVDFEKFTWFISNFRYYARITSIVVICLIILYDLYALYACESSIWKWDTGKYGSIKEGRKYYFVNIEKSNITVDDVRYKDLIEQGNMDNLEKTDKDSDIKIIIDNMYYKFPDKTNDVPKQNYDPYKIGMDVKKQNISFDHEVYGYYASVLYKIRDISIFLSLNILAYTLGIILLIDDMNRIEDFYKKLFIILVCYLSIILVLFIVHVILLNEEIVFDAKRQIMVVIFFAVYNLLTLILLFKKARLKINYVSLSYIDRLKFIVIGIFTIVFYNTELFNR